MYHVNETVSYGVYGVCRIDDIVTKDFDGKKTDYYVLKPVYDASATVFVPTGNANLVEKMRAVLSENDIDQILCHLDDDATEWPADRHERQEHWSAVLSSGNPLELVQMIRCLYLHKQELFSNKKKLQEADDRALRAAEKQINHEFAAALHIAPEDVPSYIAEKLRVSAASEQVS